MKKAACAIGLFALLPLAALGQIIPRGGDVWSTLGGCGEGPETYITLDNTDWLTLCGRTGGEVKVVFTGNNLPGRGNGDIVISRLEDAIFTSSGEAAVKVQATELAFRSVGISQTVCGPLSFKVGLSGEEQPTTTMYIHRTGTDGGTFDADLDISTKVTAYSSSGQAIGSVLKAGVLKNPTGGTPWGFKAPDGADNTHAAWYPGVNPNGMPAMMIRYHWLKAAHAYFYALHNISTATTRAGVPANCPAGR